MAPSSANVKAAQAVIASRQRFQKSLTRGTSSTKQPLSLREAATRYPGATRASIDRIVKRLEAANTLDYSELTEVPRGRRRQLTDDDEEGVVAFVIWRKRSGEPASKKEVEEAANTIRRHRDPHAMPVGRMWYPRFRKAHQEIFT
ncbi:Ff.00g078900.m01.CDS01 [Fusarium sp. VM40]|nr:Ff.00g078900.m01.CDS01 [Fusarium sp. VM40]